MSVAKQSASIAMESSGEAAARLKIKLKMKMEMAVYERVHQLASGNAVVVFAVSGCCMCHVAKQLLFSLGVGPTVVELDKEAGGAEMHLFLYHLSGDRSSHQQLEQPPVPAIFIGGKLLGGIETLIASHINGTLVPLLKDAGALWL